MNKIWETVTNNKFIAPLLVALALSVPAAYAKFAALESKVVVIEQLHQSHKNDHDLLVETKTKVSALEKMLEKIEAKLDRILGEK